MPHVVRDKRFIPTAPSIQGVQKKTVQYYSLDTERKPNDVVIELWPLI